MPAVPLTGKGLICLDAQLFSEPQPDLRRRCLRRIGQGADRLGLRCRGPQRRLGIQDGPGLDPMWIYQHLVWGGLWALLFFLPLKGSYYLRGALYSLAQTLVQLLVIFPKMGKGVWGLELGYMAPVLVTFFGVIWGLATAFWLQFSREGSESL
jgi:hypothetical protein